MEINLKDTLRALRQRKNITQETLAVHLGITPQSVGKWERGEGFPDITLLPQIAMYFNVTVDELLNVEQQRIEQEIASYMAESQRYRNNGENARNLALWEKAYGEFPNDCRVMEGLMLAINRDGVHPCPKEEAERIIQLGERILQESKDTQLRESAIQTLCYTCSSIGDQEEALRYAEMGGGFFSTREELRTFVLEGEAGVKACQSYLVSLLSTAAMTASQMAAKAAFPPEKEIQAYQFGIDLLTMLFSDGNVGFYANDISMRHSAIAQKYAQMADAAKALEHLERSAEYAVKAATVGKMRYTAPLVDRLENYPAANEKNYSGNACDLRLRSLRWEGYDFIRESERFQKVEATLRGYALDAA